MNIETVIAKIQGLRRLAASTNVHEAAVAAAAADKLIQEYRLDETALEIENDGAADGPLVDSEPLETTGWKKPRWLRGLIGGLCVHYDVAGFTRAGGGLTHFCMCGRPSDIRLTREMYAWLRSEIDRLARGVGGGLRESNSFRLGATVGVLDSLKQSKRAALAAASNQSAALVLANRGEQARGALQRELNPAKADRPRKASVDAASYRAGYEAGRRIDLAPTKRLPEGS